MKRQTKRFAIAAAALTLVAPFAATAASADPYDGHSYSDHRNDNGDSRDQRGNDNRNNSWRNNSWRNNSWRNNSRDNSRNNSWNQGGNDNRAYQGNNGWNNQYQGNWNNQYQGERSWRRGERLSSFDQARFRSFDYRREHYREPPRGYRYVRDDRGDTLLVGVLSGVILSAILNSGDRY